MEVFRNNGTLEITELDPFLAELLRQIPISANPEAVPAAEQRIYSLPADPNEKEICAEWKIYVQPELRRLFQSATETVATDLEQLAETPVDINPKGQLQELLQSISPRSPVYELVSQSGPEHEKTFVSQVVWEGIVLGQGSGRSKKQAETAAALEAMQLKRWEKKREKESA